MIGAEILCHFHQYPPVWQERAYGICIHVTKHGDHWSLMLKYAERSSGNFAAQHEAFERALEIAKNNQQEVGINGVNGKIRAKYSYGPDDCQPIG